MMKCDKRHLSTLTDMLCEIPDEQLKFFLWLDYQGMPPGKKLTVINDQLRFSNEFHSLILKGFRDKKDNIFMQLPDPKETETTNKLPLSKTLVTDYLRYHVKSSTGDRLFDYVFPPLNTDTREFLVKINYVGEATSYLERARGELARNMTNTSIFEVFEDPNAAIKESKNTPWKPFTRTSSIVETMTINQMNPYNNNKRTRSVMSDKSNYSKPPLNPYTQHSTLPTSPHTMPYASKMNYLSAASPPPLQQQPAVINRSQTNPAPTSQPFQPLKGLGGGISPMDQKVLKLESDMVLLKQTIAATTSSLQHMESEVKSQINGIEEKMENNTTSLLIQMEQNIESNNIVLESKLSKTVEEKLKQNNNNNNKFLLESMKEMMDASFNKFSSQNNTTNLAINSMIDKQECINQQIFAKLNNTSKDVADIIETVEPPTIKKLIKSGRYITRASVAKGILNATKIIANATDIKMITETVTCDSEYMEFNKENTENNYNNTDNLVNQHGATATVSNATNE
jgi:hypothetical protein